MDSKFKVTKGQKGSTQLMFYYVDKVNFAELSQAVGKHFPGVHMKDINVMPGIVNCTLTTGKDLEIESK